MNTLGFIICFALIAFSSASSEPDSLRGLQTAYADFAAFEVACKATSWNSNNGNCFNIKFTGYQCCAGSLTTVGSSLTGCYPHGGSATLASLAYECSSGFLQISIVLAFLMMLFL